MANCESQNDATALDGVENEGERMTTRRLAGGGKTDHMDVVTALQIINRSYRRNTFLTRPQTAAFLEVVIPPDTVNAETTGDMMVPEGSQ